MKTQRLTNLVTSALVAALTAGVTVVATSGAAAKPAPVTFYACLKAGTLSNVTTMKHSCARGYLAVSWNQVGEMGLTGAKGATGLTGPRGLQGVKGDAGAQGLNGDSGAVGPQGLQGVQGPKGDSGAQGVQGIKGDTGATGPNPTGGYYVVISGSQSGTCPTGGSPSWGPTSSAVSGNWVGYCPFPTN